MKKLHKIFLILIFAAVWPLASGGPVSAAAAERNGGTGYGTSAEGGTGKDAVRDEAPRYLVSQIGCMSNGSYDRYLENYIESEPSDSSAGTGNRSGRWPVIRMKFFGWDSTGCYMGPRQEYSRNMALCTDLFYLEYPQDWFLGGNSACPLILAHKSEIRQGEQDWKDYYDDWLRGDKKQVMDYIHTGGINAFLEEVVGQPVSYGCELEVSSSSEDILYYTLRKDWKQLATVVVWLNMGKVSARCDDIQVSCDPSEDYGRVMVYQEWDDVDFTSGQSIWDYASSGLMDLLLAPALGGKASWKAADYKTEYHDFVRLEGTLENRRATVYIPILTPEGRAAGNKNWVILFESFKGTKEADNAYDIQEKMIKTFIVLPYYHQVREGENLSLIAERYTQERDNAYAIAEYGANRIENPELIHPGQRIEIPLGLLFQKTHYK